MDENDSDDEPQPEGNQPMEEESGEESDGNDSDEDDEPQPQGNQLMQEDSGEESGSGESEDGSSDEELPNFDFPVNAVGGGQLMMMDPAVFQEQVLEIVEMDAMEIDAEAEVNAETFMAPIQDPFIDCSDKALENILECLCSYLTFNEIKGLRWMSPRVNMVVVDKIERFYKNCKGKFSTKFYRAGSKTNSHIAIRLNEANFHSFLFYRRHNFFKTHWQLTANKLETLELENCSLECEGFKFLIDFAPNIKKLSLKYCKLRDLDDVHVFPRNPPVTTEKIPEYLGIKVLHLEGMTMIETCFMQYLIEKIKPNTLTELSMSKCFTDDVVSPTGPIIPASEYFRYFAPLFAHLILKNAQSLKKLNFKGNSFQMIALRKLQDSVAVEHFEPTHFSIALLQPVPEEQNWTSLCQFLRTRCSKLETLNLQFVDESTVENVQDVIEDLIVGKCPLKSLNFELRGNSIAAKVELGGLLNNLKELEQLVIADTKVLNPDVKFIVGGERYFRYRLHSTLGNTLAYTERLVAESLTNITPTFLMQLPPKLKRLCLDRFMSEENICVDALSNPIVLDSFKTLTKLEIRGPYPHSMHLAIPKILTLVNLETLALTNCDIQDTFITGLGWEAIMELRRCLIYSFGVNSFSGRSRDDIERAIQDAPNHPFKNQPPAGQRPNLSELSKLKYLDLSHNPQISDIGIYDSFTLPLVETLILNNCNRVTDNGLALIGMNLPSLKRLSIKYCRKISEYGINELIKASENLHRIHTTKVVTKRKIIGFRYDLCPKYDDIVSTSIATESEGFICDDIDNN